MEKLFFVADEGDQLYNGFCYCDFNEDGWYDGHEGEEGYNLKDFDIVFESDSWKAIERWIDLNTPKFHGVFPDDC